MIQRCSRETPPSPGPPGPNPRLPLPALDARRPLATAPPREVSTFISTPSWPSSGLALKGSSIALSVAATLASSKFEASSDVFDAWAPASAPGTSIDSLPPTSPSGSPPPPRSPRRCRSPTGHAGRRRSGWRKSATGIPRSTPRRRRPTSASTSRDHTPIRPGPSARRASPPAAEARRPQPRAYPGTALAPRAPRRGGAWPWGRRRVRHRVRRVRKGP